MKDPREKAQYLDIIRQSFPSLSPNGSALEDAFGRDDWTLGAFVKGRLVSQFNYFGFTMRANGGKAVKMAGVSAVGTL